MLAEPSNASLRRVLMDALLEMNHPRAKLWLEGGVGTAELLGPLVDVVEPGFTFVEGWLHTARLKAGASRLAGHPLWATVEVLDAAGDSFVSSHPVMKSLRTVARSSAAVTQLPPQLEHLLEHRVSRADVIALSSVNTLPRLTGLHVVIAADEVASLLPRVAALTSLRVDLVDATPESHPHVVERVYRTGVERMAFGFFQGRLLLEVWRRGASYDWHATRDLHAATAEVRQRVDDAHRFLMWQLRALGVST